MKKKAPKKDEGEYEEKKERAPRQSKPKPVEQPVPASWDLVPKNPVNIDEVPIDALRGIHYFIIKRADKKLSKAELKRTLHELLANKDKQDKLVQHIVDVVFS